MFFLLVWVCVGCGLSEWVRFMGAGEGMGKSKSKSKSKGDGAVYGCGCGCTDFYLVLGSVSCFGFGHWRWYREAPVAVEIEHGLETPRAPLAVSVCSGLPVETRTSWTQAWR